MRKTFFVLILVFIFALAVGTTTYAEPGHLTYRKKYNIDGIILMKIQAGSDYDASGQYKAMVRGVGSLERNEYIAMGKNSMIADSENFWVADPDSLRGLEVAGTFRLHDQYAGNFSEGSNAESPASAVYSPQMFATSVDAKKGESGELAQSFSVDSSGNTSSFAINQHTETSDGKVKRYIDITDPASGAYLFEDSEIVGKVNITEWLNSKGTSEGFAIASSQENDGEEMVSGQEETETVVLDEATGKGSNEEPALVIDGAEIFKSVVPLGTRVEELGLDEEIIFQSDLITIKDIYVKWDDQLFGEYDPDREGSYTFAGELVFPETVASDEQVFIFHVVHVVEDPEEFKSEHFEDTVHGGENGEDKESDKDSDN